MANLYQRGSDAAQRAKEKIVEGIESLVGGPEVAYAMAVPTGKDYGMQPNSRPYVIKVKVDNGKPRRGPKGQLVIKGTEGRWLRKN